MKTLEGVPLSESSPFTPARRLWRRPLLSIGSLGLLFVLLLSGCNHAGNEGTSGGSSQETGKQSLKNLKRLGLALNMWASSHGETYPSLSDAASLKAALLPSVKDESTFLCPGTNQPYSPNPSLSGKSLSSVSNVAGTVSLYEPTATDGMRGVAYVDGHAERIAESQWSALKQGSGIP